MPLLVLVRVGYMHLILASLQATGHLNPVIDTNSQVSIAGKHYTCLVLCHHKADFLWCGECSVHGDVYPLDGWRVDDLSELKPLKHQSVLLMWVALNPVEYPRAWEGPDAAGSCLCTSTKPFLGHGPRIGSVQ